MKKILLTVFGVCLLAVVVGQGEPSVEYLEDAFDGGGYELF